MFVVTPTAAEQILRAAEAMDEGGDAPVMLRVAAKIEDGGIVYGMGFDEERENDHVIQSEGVILLIAPRSLELLTGSTLDFVELRPGEFQFVFVNPNEVGGGSCGGGGNDGYGGGCGGCGRSCG
ncbi:MAG: iron-sulfur cluster assembly accessory protein [Candidatus Nitricoxidivorans perseverans]|uniref:Iron-sulfur cluster assembly accessory protein n=1 Tax=Candidatus Nitricoxidivorans perseverans TaxID=2975601 RepID=A0AA49IXB7_9PROT|nr:MAG: iron-sulfur cluster assembly accessory protein [Candidatus Nitricoxidivorans perseverans]